MIGLIHPIRAPHRRIQMQTILLDTCPLQRGLIERRVLAAWDGLDAGGKA